VDGYKGYGELQLAEQTVGFQPSAILSRRGMGEELAVAIQNGGVEEQPAVNDEWRRTWLITRSFPILFEGIFSELPNDRDCLTDNSQTFQVKYAI